MRIGMLTGGGDCPGLNAVIRAVVRKGILHYNDEKIEGGFERCLEVIAAHKLGALIAMGGDDTQSISVELAKRNINVVGVPKTIDNDLSGTDACFGFDTAVTIATEAIDRLHSTAEAHNRVIVCEVMGRDAGWIAITGGIAGGADVIFVPEKPIDIDQAVKILKERHERGKLFSIV